MTCIDCFFFGLIVKFRTFCSSSVLFDFFFFKLSSTLKLEHLYFECNIDIMCDSLFASSKTKYSVNVFISVNIISTSVDDRMPFVYVLISAFLSNLVGGWRIILYTLRWWSRLRDCVSDDVQCCSLRLQEVISTSRLAVDKKSETKKRKIMN